MTSYATLQECKQILEADTTSHDTFLASLIVKASRRIDEFTGWKFGFNEQKKTVPITVRLGGRNAYIANQGLSLLSLTTLRNGDGNNIDASGYNLYPGYNYPKTEIELTVDYAWLQAAGAVIYEDPDGMHIRSIGYVFGGAGDPSYMGYGRESWLREGVILTGLFGYHDDYDNAWEDTGLTVAGGGLGSSARTLTVSGTIGTAVDVGDVIKIDSEYCLVTGPVSASTSSGMTGTTLNLERHYNGSSQVAHTAGVSIYRWVTIPDVKLACQLLVASYYATRRNPAGDRMVVEGLGAIQIPSGIPTKVKDVLNPYVNEITGRR